MNGDFVAELKEKKERNLDMVLLLLVIVFKVILIKIVAKASGETSHWPRWASRGILMVLEEKQFTTDIIFLLLFSKILNISQNTFNSIFSQENS